MRLFVFILDALILLAIILIAIELYKKGYEKGRKESLKKLTKGKNK